MTAWAEYNHFLGNVRVKYCMREKEIQWVLRDSFYKRIFGTTRESLVLERAPTMLCMRETMRGLSFMLKIRLCACKCISVEEIAQEP
jgi:hypothetical protein